MNDPKITVIHAGNRWLWDVTLRGSILAQGDAGCRGKAQFRAIRAKNLWLANSGKRQNPL